MRRVFRNNGLAIVCFALFLSFLVIQSVTGNREYNEDQRKHGEPGAGYVEYLGTGHFKESVFENWESEFLQMGAFVVLTVFLYQKGSPESKPLDGDEAVEAEPDAHQPAHHGRCAGAASSSGSTRTPWPSPFCCCSPALS